ncbi:MAG: LacI family DNA-binding transcriptional regulator [Actinomycetota bacterium]|nr:LacI family DNA-binding transcriptional regulator [Actinomycetota bacterium]
MGKRTSATGLRRGVTLVDVAKAADVDPSTVSRVLRDDPRTKATPETRDRIRRAAERLGYVANATARSLAVRSTSTIGLLIPNVSGFIYADIIRGASDAARDLGYVLVVADGSELGHAGDAVRRLVLEGRVDGLLLASGTVTDNVAQDLVGEAGNIVVLNRQIGGRGPRIIEDDEFGMVLGMQELISYGHTRIACLAGPPNVDTSRRRIKGYRRALREAGLPFHAGLVVHAGFDEADGYQGMQVLLRKSPPPTAVAAASLAAAVGAMAASRDAGLGIPSDVSIVAFHDAPLANYLTPPLTTIAMPLQELGRQAVEMLHRRLIGEPGPLLVKVEEPAPVLVRRKSVAVPSR